MITRDEFYTRERPMKARAPHDLRLIAQEAVRMEAVTGDPAWDFFNSYLESAIKGTARQLEIQLAQLRNPKFVNTEAIQVCKSAIAALEARIGTLEEVQGLPKYIKERGALARAQIQDLEKGA